MTKLNQTPGRSGYKSINVRLRDSFKKLKIANDFVTTFTGKQNENRKESSGIGVTNR